jgi:hypothetical protein
LQTHIHQISVLQYHKTNNIGHKNTDPQYNNRGDFNSPLSLIGRQKYSKETSELSDTTEQMNLTNTEYFTQ